MNTTHPTGELRQPNAPNNYTVSADNFERVIARLPVDQQEILRWWYFHGKEKNLSLAQLGHASGVSSTTLSRVFRGTYNADLASVCTTLMKARETIALRVDNPDFIMTSLAKRVFSICDRARILATVAILWGPMGIGKTTVLEEYRDRNNHGRTIYLRCGSAMSFGQFVNHLAKAMGVTSKNRGQHEVRDKIFALLKAGQRLLLIDEFHQIFLTTRGDTAVRIAEFLRECYDVSGCGMVLVGTEIVAEHIFKGSHKEALRQLVDRGTLQVSLPAKPTRQDIAAFFKHYRLIEPGDDEPEAAAIVRDINASAGLRKMALHLRDGKHLATKRNETYAWSHFVQAFEEISSLAKVA